MPRNALAVVAGKMTEDCIKTIKSGSDEMSVNICAMLDNCECDEENRCSEEESQN